MTARSTTASIPAPVGGWNVRDSLAELKPSEAVYLENWWPTPVDCVIRNGYVNWATGMSGTVDTILAYNGASGTKKLFAITSTGSLYDVTAQGAVGAAIVTGLANGQWQYIAYTTPGGNFLLACNGTDNMLRYNGTNWVTVSNGVLPAISTLTGTGALATITFASAHGLLTGNTITVSGASVAGFNGSYTVTVTGSTTLTYVCTASPSATGASAVNNEAITGVDPKNIISLNTFKSRIWLVQKNTLSAWYLPALAIQGAATELPLGSLFPHGGNLVSMGTWTIDVGVGIDDNACFFSSEGEIAIYKGTDPSSATTWALVGLFSQGNPIGTRCQIKYLGDVYVITDLGVAPMSESILTAQVTMKANLTDKIMKVMQDAVSTAKTSFGWQMIAYPAQNMLIVNVPSGTTSSNYQFAMNTITGAWTKFTGWNARCWESQGNSLYYGTSGTVCKAWSSNYDNGTIIQADALTAFSKLGNQNVIKKVNMVRPIVYSTGSPSFIFGANYDYDQYSSPTGTFTFASPTVMTWGAMTWGSMTWGGTLVQNRNWQFASGYGYTAAMRFKAQNNGSETRWASTDYVYEHGGII